VAETTTCLQRPTRSNDWMKAVKDAAVKSLRLALMSYFHLQFICRVHKRTSAEEARGSAA
jgi:hypothetical protein